MSPPTNTGDQDEPTHRFYAEIVLDITTRNTERNSIYIYV